MSKIIWTLAAVWLVAGCGGGSGGNSQPQSPPASGTPPAQTPQPSGVGAAGGVISGPNGARVAIPPGALSQNVDVAIAQADEGAPALPEGLTAVGEIFAFTPHGTTFASPVTVTMPFDPALLAQGMEPALFKTGPGQAGWEAVENARRDANTMVGEVDGFSYFVVAFAPLIRIWAFTTHTSDDQAHENSYVSNGGGVLRETTRFGEMTIAPAGRDLFASGEVYSSATGNTYWVEAEAPTGEVLRSNEAIGGETVLWQLQQFRKDTAAATLRYTITQAWIDAIDRNGSMPRFAECPWAEGTGAVEVCKDEVFGELDLKIVAIMVDPGPPLNPDPGHDVPERNEAFEAHHGSVRLWGWQENWKWKVHTDVRYEHDYNGDEGMVTELVNTIPIFEERHFEETVSDAGSMSATDFSVRLREPVTVEIDVSHIPIGAKFRIETIATALAHNRRGYELSYVGAKLRDPAQMDGISLETTGLTPIVPEANSAPFIVDEPECPAEGVSEDSGTVQFSAPNYSLAEFRHASGGVLVTRVGGSEGTVVAEVTTADGTAVGGVHYTPVARTIVFRDGDTTPRLIHIPIVNDDVDADDRTINLALTSSRNCANLGEPASAVVTIIDDETPPPTTFTVSGTLSGLSGSELVLEDVTTGERISPANGPFSFAYLHPDGSSYDVRVVTQPSQPQQICTVNNGSSVIAGASVTNVTVTCTDVTVSAMLDPTFGVEGKVTSGLPGGGRALALQSDGRILALSRSQLARFNENGSLDTSFGTGGVISTAFNGVLGEESRDVALQSDGRIIVVGYTRASPTVLDYDFAISRYNSDGTLDGTFGDDGTVTIDFYGRVDQAHRVAIQGDDRIVVGGHAEHFDSSDPLATIETSFAVVRLTANGALDTTFGADPPFVGTGMQTAFGGGRALAYALAIGSDGKIVLGGRVGSDGADPPAAALARWSSNGVGDTDQDSDPLIYLGLDGSHRGTASLGDTNIIEDLIVTEDGALVGVMNSTAFGRPRFMLVEFAIPFGMMVNRPPPFSYTDVPIGPYDDVMTALTRQADGKFIVVGSASSAETGGDFGIVRFNANRSVDTGFGTNGVLTIDFFGGADTANDVVVQPDGKIVVLGVARSGSSNGLGLVRVLP